MFCVAKRAGGSENGERSASSRRRKKAKETHLDVDSGTVDPGVFRGG
jgi:hypothetical protein